jgi:hypothetical protein
MAAHTPPDQLLLNLTPAQVAYMAGIFDGEGCVLISRVKEKTAYRVECMISNTDLTLLQTMQLWCNGIGYIRAGNYKAGQTRPCYTWRMSSRRAALFMSIIRPYCIVKANQIDIAIQLSNRIRDYDGRKVRKPGQTRNKGIPEEELAFRDNLFCSLKELRRVIPTVYLGTNACHAAN